MFSEEKEKREDLSQFGKVFHWRHMYTPVVIDKRWNASPAGLVDWEMNILYIFGLRVAIWRKS